MAHCEICGSHLGLRDALRSLVRRRSQTSPARTPGGERIDTMCAGSAIAAPEGAASTAARAPRRRLPNRRRRRWPPTRSNKPDRRVYPHRCRPKCGSEYGQTEFHQFLADFAEAIEQAAMGEPAEGLNSLLEAERRAVEA